MANVILAWKLQVLNAAWDAGIQVASENALPCYDRDGYNKILENSKPKDDPDGHHLAAFTYLRLGPTLMEEENFKEFARFVKRLHGQNRFFCFPFFVLAFLLLPYVSLVSRTVFISSDMLNCFLQEKQSMICSYEGC